MRLYFPQWHSQSRTGPNILSQNSLKGYFSIFREGIQTIAKSGFQILLIDMIVFVCFSNVVLYLQQPLLLDRAFPVAYFGIVSVIVTITTTVALKVFGVLEKRIKQPKRLLSILTTIFCVALPVMLARLIWRLRQVRLPRWLWEMLWLVL